MIFAQSKYYEPHSLVCQLSTNIFLRTTSLTVSSQKSHSFASIPVHTTKQNLISAINFMNNIYIFRSWHITFSVSTHYVWAKERNFPHLIWQKSIKCTNVQLLRQRQHRQQQRHQKLASRRATVMFRQLPLSCRVMSCPNLPDRPQLDHQRQLNNDHQIIATIIRFWSYSVGCTMAGTAGIEASF